MRVTYHLAVVYKDKNGERVVTVSNPTDFPDTTDYVSSKVKEVQEPIVKASIIVPQGRILYKMEVCVTDMACRIPW